jgi:signal transduction histidine kinase
VHRLEKIDFDIPGLGPGSIGAYAFAIAVTALATLIRLAIEPYVAGVQFITFFPSIIVTTLVCGARAGILSVILSAAAAYIFVLAPQVSFGVPLLKELLALAIFLLVASAVVALIGALRFAIRRYRELSRTLEQRVEARTKELVHTQESLVQAQKMEALGQMTGGMAHDFNNMLAVVIGNLDMARRRLAKGEHDIARYLERASEGAGKAATLIQRLLAFARRQPLRPELIDVNKVVSSASELLRRTLGETVNVECVLGMNLWIVRADPIQLEAAIVNLALNARDAMPDGGPLTLETANIVLDERYTSTRADVQPGQYVMVAVTDAGAGMDAKTLAKATEHFLRQRLRKAGLALG